MQRSTIRTGLLALASGLLGPAAFAVNMDLVTVGNPGNAGGDPWGNGGVSYTYEIGKYEVTAGQYTAFLNAVAATDTYGLYSTKMTSSGGCNIVRSGSPGSYTYSVAPDRANRPVNVVSWGDVARFANWMHNGQPTGVQDLNTTEDGSYYLNGAISDDALLAVTRRANATWAIPTEDEWVKAAYHKNDGATGNYWYYPTSSDSAPSNQLIDPDPGNNATYRTGSFTIGSPYYMTEVGAHENSRSPYGTFDQGGNVAEWNETAGGSTRGVRGGDWFGGLYGLGAGDRTFNSAQTEDLWFGFRLAYVPEPATLVLLTLGGMAVIRRRRTA